MPYAHVNAGSTMPLKFAFGDANGVTMPDAEAVALVASCSVRSSSRAATRCRAAPPTPGANRFEFRRKTSKASSGPHRFTVIVFDGAAVLHSELSNVFVMT